MKLIQFSTELTFDVDESSEEGKAELFQLAKQEEDNRRQIAIRVCKDANVGLNIRVFSSHTEYYMDTYREAGEIQEEVYSGVTDLRDQDHFV